MWFRQASVGFVCFDCQRLSLSSQPFVTNGHQSQRWLALLNALSLAYKQMVGSQMEVIMKKFFLRSALVVAVALGASLAVFADTIHLKDGSVIRGQIVSFKNEQFTILVGSGARGRKSRITVYMEDVESIDFDASGNTSGPAEDNSSSQPAYQPPYQQPTNQPTNQPPYQQPANQPSNQPSYQPPPTNTSGRGPVPVPIQINVRVHADNASNGWTNSGFVVRRGQRIRITASGRVSLGKDRNGADRWS